MRKRKVGITTVEWREKPTVGRDARGLESSLKFRVRVFSVPRRSEGDSEGGTMKL